MTQIQETTIFSLFAKKKRPKKKSKHASLLQTFVPEWHSREAVTHVEEDVEEYLPAHPVMYQGWTVQVWKYHYKMITTKEKSEIQYRRENRNSFFEGKKISNERKNDLNTDTTHRKAKWPHCIGNFMTASRSGTVRKALHKFDAVAWKKYIYRENPWEIKGLTHCPTPRHETEGRTRYLSTKKGWRFERERIKKDRKV